RIPTLAEVVDTIPAGKRLFIEVKGGNGFIPAFGRVLAKHPLPSPKPSPLRGEREGKSLAVIGFDLPLMRQIKSTFPEVEVCWIAEFKRSFKTLRWTPRPSVLIEQAVQAGLD